jgi:hypothetical protein
MEEAIGTYLFSRSKGYERGYIMIYPQEMAMEMYLQSLGTPWYPDIPRIRSDIYKSTDQEQHLGLKQETVLIHREPQVVSVIERRNSLQKQKRITKRWTLVQARFYPMYPLT